MTADPGRGQRIILLGLVLAVPPVFWTGTLLYTDIKVLAVRGGFLLLSIAAIIDLLRGLPVETAPLPICLISAAFCVFQGMVTWANPFGDWSIYGDTCLAVGYFLAAIPLLKDESFFRQIAYAIVLGAVLVCGYYLIHTMGWDPVAWFNAGDNAYGSSFGNRNFMAYFLVCAFPFAIYLALDARPINRLIYAGAAIGIASTIVYGKSRSGSLALILLAPAFLWFLGGLQRVKWRAVVFRVLSTTAIVLFAVKAIAFVPKAAHWSRADLDVAMHGRLSIWSGTLALIADSPWIGHGSGSFPQTFPDFQTPEFTRIFGFFEPIFNSHCVGLEILVESGIVGLTLFLALLILGSGLARVRPEAVREHRVRVFCCGASLAGAGIFSITGEISHVLFCTLFSWLALAAFYGGVNGGTHALKPGKAPRYPNLAAAALILIAACWAALRLGTAFAANCHTAKATALINLQSGFRTARGHLEKALELDPGSPYALYQLAFLDLNEGRPRQALTHYEAIRARFPYFESIHYNMGIAAIASGEPSKAIDYLTTSVRLFPSQPNALFYLARLNLDLSRFDEARSWLYRLRETGIRDKRITELEARVPGGRDQGEVR